METIIVIIVVSVVIAGAAYMTWDIRRMRDAGVEVPDIPYTHPSSTIPFIIGAIPLAIVAPQILAYVVLAHLVWWIYDKMWWRHVDRVIEEYVPKGIDQRGTLLRAKGSEEGSDQCSVRRVSDAEDPV